MTKQRNNNKNDMIFSTVLGKNKPLTEERSTLEDGQVVVVDNNTVISNKHLIFTADIKGKLSGTVRMGHGTDSYSSAYLDITPTHLRVFHYYTALDQTAEVEHGLDISDLLTVNIDVAYSYAKITISTSSGMFAWENVYWEGRNGDVFATVIEDTLANVKLKWFADGYQRSIYLFGDSYFNTQNPSRWPYYLIRDGYTNNFMTGYPGMASARALVDFKLAMERGTPEYAVWCMGMNNGDKDGKINQSYLESVTEFLKICREKDITPILSTIPSTPIAENSYKNAWVREQGVRYIDFARAVGGAVYNGDNLNKKYIMPDGTESKNVTGYDWYPEMLHADLVHPLKKGAEALYMQVLIDFPEIMQK